MLTRVIYEKRIGARGQIEFTLPFEWMQQSAADGAAEWEGGVGDAAVSAKRVLFASLRSGAIISLGGELVLPTGNENKGLGSGTAVFEPYIAYGQLLPCKFFMQFQGGSGISFDNDKVEDEAFWRIAAGRTFRQGHLGRAWTPMVELLGATKPGIGSPYGMGSCAAVSGDAQQPAARKVQPGRPHSDQQHRCA